jgi:sulfatase maturation enzyme AslB (radical SAM superfamily)
MQLHARGDVCGLTTSVIGRIATPAERPSNPADHILLLRDGDAPTGWSDYAGVLSIPPVTDLPGCGISGVTSLGYLNIGDVVALHPSGVVQVLYRRTSHHNTLLLTERCNSLCVMCSQPPRDEDDSWRVPQILRALDLIDPACPELVFTGGEPLLLGGAFFSIVERAKQGLPTTALHILTWHGSKRSWTP